MPEPPERSNRRPNRLPPKAIPPLKLPPLAQNSATPIDPSPSVPPAEAPPVQNTRSPHRSSQDSSQKSNQNLNQKPNQSSSQNSHPGKLPQASDPFSPQFHTVGGNDNRPENRDSASKAASSDPAAVSAGTPAPPSRTSWLKFPTRHLHWWAILLVFGLSGAGILAAIALLRLPELPNCPRMFLPTASASLRLYCAQVAAEKRTLDNLLEAIDLVNALPDDHPLRPEIDRSIESWASEILNLAEESFQTGKLNQAVNAARKIPANTSAHKLVEDRVKQWQTVWTEAEDLYQKAEAELKQLNVRQAFLLTSRLSDVDNRYWSSTKYQELSGLITSTRSELGQLNRAKGLIDRGGVDNLMAAMKIITEIQPASFAYKRAQQMLPDLGRDLLDLAEAALDRRDYSQAMNILSLIPESAGLQQETQDFNLLATAQSQAWSGTVDDLEAAIVAAQRIRPDRPLYSKAQRWVNRWQVEIKDVTILNRADQLAAGGTLNDLRVAIAEAQQIPSSNPRGDEARDKVNQWRTQIETTEDQPILDRADQLSVSGDIAALQTAISEASRIQSGRALYADAQDRIRSWRDRVERFQDQPLLDRARQLAAAGDLSSAIQVANQIGSGRSLYNAAQTEIGSWRSRTESLTDEALLDRARQLANEGRYSEAIEVANQIIADRSLYSEAQSDIQAWSQQSQGQSQMQEAYRAASAGSTPMLISAIRIANRIPGSSPAREEADRMIDQWSQEVLQRANSQAASDPASAIRIANSIPPNSSLYGIAQQQIQVWQNSPR